MSGVNIFTLKDGSNEVKPIGEAPPAAVPVAAPTASPGAAVPMAQAAPTPNLDTPPK